MPAAHERAKKISELHDRDGRLGQPEQTDRWLKVESAWPGCARVDHQGAPDAANERLVGMAVHHNVGRVRGDEAFGRRTPELVSMTHVHSNAIERIVDCRGKCSVGRIGVPEDSTHRRNAAESAEHHRAPDVTGVKYQVRARKRSDRFRADQSMGVGDQAYEHGDARLSY